ncbi:MAG: hypothetical protein LBI27_06355 [Clostridiales bacterium]|jgi:hypothetical protein|nr:hypothetical protein [Clostridiales bacterium]
MDSLKQAKELADRILEITKAHKVVSDKEVDESEVEAYVEMLEERGPLIDELTDLRQKLDDDAVSSAEFYEIEKIISEIAEINKTHIIVMKHMHKNAQNSYKEIKQGQRIHAGYNPLPGDEVSSQIDVRH